MASQVKTARNAEIKFYVPSTFNVIIGQEKTALPISEETREYFVNMVALKFTEWFGGNTITCGQGRWIDTDTQTIVCEDVYIVSSLLVGRCKLTDKQTQEISAIAETIKRLLWQDAVMWTIQEFTGNVYFV